jgi:G:T-mismatch repair DNA endonuclease (very short patch repair protein)
MKKNEKTNYLTLINNSYMKPTKKKPIRVGLFRCDCGTEKVIRIQSVKSETTKSCGCYNRKAASKRMLKMNEGGHGKLDHALYQCWKSMKNRGEYIEEWSNFQAFYDWAIQRWKEGLVLSRKNPNQPFSKTNANFITRSEATKDNFDLEKSRQTCLEKYGVDHPNKLSSMLEKSLKTKEEKYGRAFLINSNAGKAESEVRDYLTELGHSFPSNRSILKTQEIDMYNEDLGLAIEYCGLFWHHENSKTKRDKNYHKNKLDECNKKNIRLITIFEDEWNNKRTIVKSILSSCVGHFAIRIFARKTTCKIIDKKAGKNFIDKNHLQGQKKCATVYFGLYFESELVAVMSFAPHHRSGKGIVLDRLCFKVGTQVVGGASKLMKAGKKWMNSNQHTTIVSWSDNRWSQGSIYTQLGFVLEGELMPDYSYVKTKNPKERIPKQSMTKSKIGCPKDVKEKDFAFGLGFSRIWDCGKKRWKLEI